MATALIPTLQKFLRSLPQLQRFTFDIPSVLPASTSPRYELLIFQDEGVIQQLRINYPLTTDVVAFIFTSDLGARNTLDHLIETPTISDGCFSQGNLAIIFENTDPIVPPKCGNERLYIELDNTGLSATGVIQFELIIRSSGQG